MILKEAETSGQQLDHLGLIAAVIKRLKLIERIDAKIPVSKEKGAKVSIGQRVAAMILNGLGFTDDRLYIFPEFLENKPIARLIAPNLSAADFNDDALGRGLDALFDYGETKLFSELAFHIGLDEKLLGSSAHFDTTSLSLYGEYEKPSSESLPSMMTDEDHKSDRRPIDITYGYSKANRPDLKQVVLTLATTGAANFPIWMESCSGNTSDKRVLQEAAERMRQFCKQLESAPSFIFVGDSAIYERCVKEAGELKWLSRVPEKLKEAKRWIQQPDDVFAWISLDKGYRMTLLTEAKYGEVEQRWIMFFSQQAFMREIKTLKRRIAKEHISYNKSLWHMSHEIFKCEHDARAAGAELTKKLKYHQVSWNVKTTEKHHGVGRPKKGAQPSVVGYQLEGTLLEDNERIAKLSAQKGRFILASNELDTEKLSEEAFLPTYKDQIKTEQGFKFIKSDAFEVDSVFLKTPSRIQALMMVMTLCLMVYSVAQFHLRKALEQDKTTIPDQKKRPTKTPSMAWVFRLFQGIQLWIIRKNSLMQELVVNLNSLTRRIIRYFGPEAEKIYASSG